MSGRQAAQPDLLTLIEQAREATRELRAAMKDLKQAQRDAEEGITRLMQDAVVDQLDAIVKREVAAARDQFHAALDKAVATATGRVAASCQALYELYMRGEERNSISIEQAMDAQQVLRKWHAQRGGTGNGDG